MFPNAIRQLALNFNIMRKSSASKVEPLDTLNSLNAGDVKQVQQKRVSSFLSMLLQDTVEVVFTDNRTTMISFSKKTGVLKLRLHKMFQEADDAVLKALSVYVRGIPSIGASKKLDEFIKSNRNQIRQRTQPRRMKVFPEGIHIDLSQVLSRVSQTYFADSTEGVKIGWGRARARRRRRTRSRSRALATYCFEDTTIRVNPVLDSPKVPDFIIDWIVYHELLHHILPVEKSGNRKRYHTSKFRALERAYPLYDEARVWEKQNLDWLLK